MAKFVIRRESPNAPISGILPSGASAVMGAAFVIASKDGTSGASATTANPGANTFALAHSATSTVGPNSTRPVRVGFVTQPVRQTAGLSPDEILFGLVTYADSNADTTGAGEVMTPFEAGKTGVIKEAIELEVESPDNLVASGTGALTGSTAIGTKLAFSNGKFYVAQTNDYAEFVVASQMTPEVAGQVRVFVQQVQGGIVA